MPTPLEYIRRKADQQLLESDLSIRKKFALSIDIKLLVYKFDTDLGFENRKDEYINFILGISNFVEDIQNEFWQQEFDLNDSEIDALMYLNEAYATLNFNRKFLNKIWNLNFNKAAKNKFVRNHVEIIDDSDISKILKYSIKRDKLVISRDEIDSLGLNFNNFEQGYNFKYSPQVSYDVFRDAILFKTNLSKL